MLINIKNSKVQYLYNEEIDLSNLGKQKIKRASQVEPNENGKWFVDLTLIGGNKIEGFNKRSEAIKFEIDWIEKNIL